MSQVKNYIFQNLNFVDFTVYQYGEEQCRPLHFFGPAIRNHYLLHYVISGKGTYHINDIHYELRAGEAFLICPNVVTIYNADARDPWHYMWIEFDGLKASEYLAQAGLTPSSPIYRPMVYERENPVLESLSYIIGHPEESPLHLMGHFYLFLDGLIRCSSYRKSSKTGNLQEFYVQEAIQYIERRYTGRLTIEEIAEHCNLNRSYFGRIFREVTHSTPQEFLMNYRIQKACQLLANTNYSIGEIASMVGYENQLHFSRAFKSICQLPPREWRSRSKAHSGQEQIL